MQPNTPLARFRSQYPEYSDLPDQELADKLHAKLYSDMPVAEFNSRLRIENLPDHGLPPGFVLDPPQQQTAGASHGLPPGYVLDPSPASPTRQGKGLFDDIPVTGSPKRAGGLFDDIPGPKTAPPPRAAERATFLPFMVDEQGKGHLAVPGFIHGPYEAAKTLLSPEGQYRPGTQDERGVALGLEAASAAMPGTLPRGGLTREAYRAAKVADDAAAQAFGPKLNPTELDARIQKYGSVPTAEAARNEVLGAAERQGVDVPRYMASDSLIAKRVAGGLRDIPIVGDAVANATTKMADQLGTKVGDVADGLAPNASPYGAGQSAKDALVDWVKSGSKVEIAHGYDIVDKLIKPDTKVELLNTRKRATEITLKDIESASEDGQKIIGLVRDAITRPGGLTYEGIKELRSRIGNRLSGDIVEPGTSQKLLKGVYESLTKDLEQAVYRSGVGKSGSSGKRAIAAWRSANDAASAVYDKISQLSDIVGMNGEAQPQRIFDGLMGLASSGSRGDAGRLHLAKQIMGPDAWNEVAAAKLSGMGLDKNGRFSPARFTSEYSSKKLTDEAKLALFGSDGKAVLDDLAKLSMEWERNSGFGNPSGTGRALSVMTGITSAWANPLLLVAEIGTGSVLARVLSKPASAKALNNWAKAYAQRAAKPSPATDLFARQASRALAIELADVGAGSVENISDALWRGQAHQTAVYSQEG